MSIKKSFLMQYPHLLWEWNKQKNRFINPLELSEADEDLEVWWTCYNGHSYKETIGNRLNPRMYISVDSRELETKGMCPFCSGKTLLNDKIILNCDESEERFARVCFNALIDIKIKFEPYTVLTQNGENYRYSAYLPSERMLIEFDCTDTSNLSGYTSVLNNHKAYYCYQDKIPFLLIPFAFIEEPTKIRKCIHDFKAKRIIPSEIVDCYKKTRRYTQNTIESLIKHSSDNYATYAEIYNKER